MKRNPRLLMWVLIFISLGFIFINLPPFSFSIPNFKATVPGQKIKSQVISYPGFSSIQFHKGLDLQGGTSITLRANMENVPAEKKQDALNLAKTILENRVNLYGVSEPIIQTSVVNGDYRIVVELPGVTSRQAKDLVGTTAQLSFWEQATSSAIQVPSGVPITALGNLFKPTNLTGKDLQSSSVTFDQNTGAPQVQLNFTSLGAEKFAQITTRDVGKILAIVLDNQVVEAPRVNQAIVSGNAVITGNFTTNQAKNLSIELQAGVLPVSLSVLATDTVGATLGQDALIKSIFAGVLGFIIVIVFMVVLYGRLGIIASSALLLYTLIVLSLFKLIPVTLTLAGIAGFILSVGMAVDANILIFERMKEELRLGKPLSIAIELGFSRAWSSIRDSNISTLITSGVLFQFGTGIVRGFALTLAIGVIISMFSAVVVTRTLVRIFYGHN